MWRLLKYFFISLLVLVILVCASIGIVLNFIFTPEKLTPIVEKSANEFLNAEVHFDAIELTFFSTFPEFGLEMRNGRANCVKRLEDAAGAGFVAFFFW